MVDHLYTTMRRSRWCIDSHVSHIIIIIIIIILVSFKKTKIYLYSRAEEPPASCGGSSCGPLTDTKDCGASATDCQYSPCKI